MSDERHYGIPAKNAAAIGDALDCVARTQFQSAPRTRWQRLRRWLRRR